MKIRRSKESIETFRAKLLLAARGYSARKRATRWLDIIGFVALSVATIGMIAVWMRILF
ncbi:hypothetical protein LCGC14_0995100 [marine sediment metagenome]|uniref:Uncharacterized protein n=1 Tax=marine sediment metagenome TaxID=412755 RepID=A0A0F9RAZ9_9ZZZZ